MLKRLATMGAVAGSAVAIAAGPAAADPTNLYNPVVTGINRYAHLGSGGTFVGVTVTYKCDPDSTSTSIQLAFRQVIHGTVHEGDKYFQSGKACTGHPITETIRVFANSGQPAWRTGQGTVTVQVTNSSDYDYVTGAPKTKTVTVRR